MDKVGSTLENLEAAIGGEAYEFEAEKVHAELY